MSFFVISIHTLTFDTTNIVGRTLGIIVGCAVPFYFIVSGFLVLQGIDLSSKENVEAQIVKSIKRTAKLYFTWIVIYLPIDIYFSHFTTDPLKSTLLFIRGIFLIGENSYSWPLWYLLSTLYALLFIYVTIHFFKWRKTGIYVSACISLVLAYTLNTLSSAEISNSVFRILQKLLHVSIANGRIFIGLFYITVGFAIAEYRSKIQEFLSRKKKIILLCGSVISIMIYIFSDSQSTLFFMPIVVVPIVIICLKPCNVSHPIFKKMRNCSTIIYLTHMIWFVLYSSLILKNVGYHCIESFIVTSFCSLVGAILFIVFDHNGKLARVLL